MTTVSVTAFMTNRRFDLRRFSMTAKGCDLIKKDLSFQLYKWNDEAYVYIKSYGAVCMMNVRPEDIEVIGSLLSLDANILESAHREDLELVSGASNMRYDFDRLELPDINEGIAHIVCLNLTQSVALFQYQEMTEQLLEDTRRYTTELERKGRLSINRKELLKYIGATLNMKNAISENLYIFDFPKFVWDDELVNRLDKIMNEELEIKARYLAIKEMLGIVSDNLDLFKDISLHKHSSVLEWIIIILILFEVLHVLAEKIL